MYLVNANKNLLITGKLIRQADILVKTVPEQSDCMLSGMALLPDKRMVLCDSENNSLKLVNLESNILVDSLHLSSRPHAVCGIPESCVAVTLPMVHKIQIFSTQPNIEMTKIIETSGSCQGITFWQDTFIVTNKKGNKRSLAVMDIDGHVSTEVVNDTQGRPLIKGPSYVSVGGLTPTLHVSDKKHSSVTKMDLQLTIRDRIALHSSARPNAMFQLDDNQLLVCSGTLSGIHDKLVLLNSETGESRIIIDGVHGLMCAGYSEELEKLYVSCLEYELSDVRNSVLVFDSVGKKQQQCLLI